VDGRKTFNLQPWVSVSVPPPFYILSEDGLLDKGGNEDSPVTSTNIVNDDSVGDPPVMDATEGPPPPSSPLPILSSPPGPPSSPPRVRRSTRQHPEPFPSENLQSISHYCKLILLPREYSLDDRCT
jgi:hypothetical protein